MTASARLIACNCFASRKAARLITKMYEDHLSRVDLTSTQFSILVYVDEVEVASMKDLVEALVMERTKLAQAVPVWRDAQAEFESKFGAGLAEELRQSLLALAP
jgi:hypothetical protein